MGAGIPDGGLILLRRRIHGVLDEKIQAMRTPETPASLFDEVGKLQLKSDLRTYLGRQGADHHIGALQYLRCCQVCRESRMFQKTLEFLLKSSIGAHKCFPAFLKSCKGKLWPRVPTVRRNPATVNLIFVSRRESGRVPRRAYCDQRVWPGVYIAISVRGEIPMLQASSHQQSDLSGAGHARWVRIAHWAAAVSVLTLAFTGFVILMAHPRLYWGPVGNDLTPAFLELPISRNHRHGGWEPGVPFFERSGSPVTATRTYDILNENGWARSLHFLAAWLLVATGSVYVLAGIFSGHFRRHMLPRAGELRPRLLWQDLTTHLRLQIQPARGGPPYGLLQKGIYCGVVFLALPMMVITGMAMSPAITAAYPFLAGVFGGSQSARTIHFFCFALLALFVLVHVLMVILSGFKRQVRAMTFGN